MVRILAAIVIMLFIIASISPNEQKLSLAEFSKKSQFISGLAKVIDGDSIKINNQEIRLVGIDAPEYKQECFDEDMTKYQCGLVSMNFLKKLISTQKVACYYHKKDIYDRILGKCKVGNIDINRQMVAQGWAILYNFPMEKKEMQNLEIKARNNKIGLWQGSFLEPRKYRKRNF